MCVCVCVSVCICIEQIYPIISQVRFTLTVVSFFCCMFHVCVCVCECVHLHGADLPHHLSGKINPDSCVFLLLHVPCVCVCVSVCICIEQIYPIISQVRFTLTVVSFFCCMFHVCVCVCECVHLHGADLPHHLSGKIHPDSCVFLLLHVPCVCVCVWVCASAWSRSTPSSLR